MPIVKQTVTAITKPSGIPATATATEIRSISKNGRPVIKPLIKRITQNAPIINPVILAK